MARDGEAFLSRWSRLKREQAASPTPPEKPGSEGVETERVEQAPPLPPVESLTPESDFTPFMQAKVPAETRRAALKKLFADPAFGVPDPYEAYSGDWTGGEPIPAEMLKTLHQAKRVLFDEPPPPPVRDEDPEAAPAEGEVVAAAVDAPAAPEAQSMPPQAEKVEKASDGGA